MIFIICLIIYILFVVGILAVAGSNRRAKRNMQMHYWKQGKIDPWTKFEQEKQ